MKSDSENNHLFIGEGKDQADDYKRFTCVELEVYAL